MNTGRYVYRLSLTAALSLSTANISIAETAFPPPSVGSTVCDQLASVARIRPIGAWKNHEQALAPSLVLESSTSKPTPLEAKLAANPRVRKAMDAGQYRVFYEKMPGAGLYMLETIQGSLHCSNATFITAKNEKAFKIVGSESGDDLGCSTLSADFGLAFGQEVFVDHGVPTEHTLNELLSIRSWNRGRWGPQCTLELRFNTLLSVNDRYCLDADVCKLVGGQAADLAAEFNRESDPWRENFNFTYRNEPTDAAKAALERAKKVLAPKYGRVDFPTFGVRSKWNYSTDGVTLFPLLVGKQWYIAAIGHSNTGWRETNATLLSVFSENHGVLTPLAGYVITPTNGGLIETVVRDAGPLRGKATYSPMDQ